MSKLKAATDGLYWLFTWTDAISSLVLLRLGFPELNPFYALLGHYEFWALYAAASVGLWCLIKGFQYHFMHHKCSVVSYVALFTFGLCRAICTLNNIGQVMR